ncbi:MULTISPECIES: hypothetical protein [Burkholderiaceae]|jgi:hypothetical protein|uniref:Lipoprotein n=1 Tax=Paraburkholderia phytofirmans (strain DSM 17436 / LMG 22146 / PsJN) TaxID=398527 RepID=B2T044_PARPJ|nr:MULTISPECIES: hypothetical protein [Burkholderiaceae]ACD14605.1 hypothetical protein Bphyt_0166 [Paraburkholderia phytofirmans PsJN]UTP22290.1 hypothetical protein NMB33_18615 [Burkholderia sp. FXe9]MBX3801422.1 hypothetical protein [Burkholderia cepacia]MBX3923727.1 hypothetical protein [Burkholderia cepacia]MBX3939769.1 hypothetical protein [Burkholderia cepacia]
MSRSTVAILIVQLVMLMNGCSDSLPKLVLPDGSHRVPVNRVQPVPPSDGGSHEQ